MKYLILFFLAVVFAGGSVVHQIKSNVPAPTATIMPKSAEYLKAVEALKNQHSEAGSFLEFENVKGEKVIILVNINGVFKLPTDAETEYRVFRTERKVDETYLQQGDRIEVTIKKLSDGNQLAIRVKDYTDYSDPDSVAKEKSDSKDYPEAVEYTNLVNTNSWKTYTRNFDGLRYNFKYPGNFTYSDKDFSGPIGFYLSGNDTSTGEQFQVSRVFSETAVENESFWSWYADNNPKNFQVLIKDIQEIYLPKTKVIKIIYSHSYDSDETVRYLAVSNGIVVNLEKRNDFSEQDLLTVINSMQVRKEN
jgi:hypothetical protein